MKNDFRAWLAKAKPGDCFEYHRGFLAVDLGGESKKRRSERRALRELSKAVLHAGRMGLVHLVQHRLGLGRAATFLRKAGIEIGFEREGRARTRVIRITAGELPLPETGGVRPSASSAPSAIQPKPIPANGFASRGLRTVGDTADGSQSGDGPIVRDNPVKSNAETDADGADANHPPHSGRGKESTPGWRMRL